MSDHETRRQMRRAEVPAELTWNLSDIYPSVTTWEADLQAVETAIPSLAAYRGRLGEGAQTLLAYLRSRDAVAERFERVAAYAHFSLAVDGTSQDAQAMQARAMELSARIGSALAFVSNELLSLPEGTLESWLEAEPGLAV